jgi:hypothetical protein
MLTHPATSNLDTTRLRRAPQLKSLEGLSAAKIWVLAAAPNYRNEPEKYWLEGPTKDVIYLEDVISGCTYIQLTPLCGPAATSDNIIQQVGRLLPRCGKGDLFVIYFAGHGSCGALPTRGYEFAVHHEADSSSSQRTDLTYRNLLDHIARLCPPDVYVLLVRDTCAAGPSEEEIRDMLAYPKLSIIVLAACGSEEQTWECGVSPHSVFLRSILNAIKRLNADLEVAERYRTMDEIIGSMIDMLLSQIETSGKQQTPRLEPHESRSKVPTRFGR